MSISRKSKAISEVAQQAITEQEKISGFELFGQFMIKEGKTFFQVSTNPKTGITGKTIPVPSSCKGLAVDKSVVSIKPNTQVCIIANLASRGGYMEAFTLLKM
jgi:hypothetical protein